MLDATLHREKVMEHKLTLYLSKTDPEDIENLRIALTPEIAQLPNKKDYMDTHGRLSVAGMFRYLRDQELIKRGLK